jgi:outer membrane protein OmpA-like peptidoglycan-associated protein
MSKLIIAGVAVSAALSLSACATKDYVNTHVATVQTQVDSLQGQQKDQGAQLAQLDQTSRDALQRAEDAGKLAEGKFMYQVVLSDDSMKFPLSSSQLSSEAQTRLMDFVQKLKADNKNVYLEIQGYTDNTGSAAENLRLGQERAEAVRRFMSQQGVALNRMATISYGDEQPVAPNTTRVGRAQNRRVVLVVLA